MRYTTIVFLKIIFVLVFFSDSAIAQNKTASAKTSVIEGQMYIVTKGQGVYKLPLFEVRIYKENELDRELKRYAIDRLDEYKHWQTEENEKELKYIEAKRDYEGFLLGLKLGLNEEHQRIRFTGAYKLAMVNYKMAMKNVTQIEEEQSVFKNLEPLIKVKTDIDGKFRFQLPSGKYVIYSEGSRSLPDGEERYRWLLKFDAKKPLNSIALTNDNLDETRCEDCIDTKSYFR